MNCARCVLTTQKKKILWIDFVTLARFRSNHLFMMMMASLSFTQTHRRTSARYTNIYKEIPDSLHSPICHTFVLIRSFIHCCPRVVTGRQMIGNQAYQYKPNQTKFPSEIPEKKLTNLLSCFFFFFPNHFIIWPNQNNNNNKTHIQVI